MTLRGVRYKAGIILSREALRELKAGTDQDDEILIKLPKTVQSPATVPLAAATAAAAASDALVRVSCVHHVSCPPYLAFHPLVLCLAAVALLRTALRPCTRASDLLTLSRNILLHRLLPHLQRRLLLLQLLPQHLQPLRGP